MLKVAIEYWFTREGETVLFVFLCAENAPLLSIDVHILCSNAIFVSFLMSMVMVQLDLTRDQDTVPDSSSRFRTFKQLRLVLNCSMESDWNIIVIDIESYRYFYRVLLRKSLVQVLMYNCWWRHLFIGYELWYFPSLHLHLRTGLNRGEYLRKQICHFPVRGAPKLG